MMDSMELSDDNMNLVAVASDYLVKNYEKGKHHVACALQCEEKVFLSLHLDTKGFDVCAEPIAISNALMEGQTQFDSIVAVMKDELGEPRVIAPCGNCRQILYEYAPLADVIVPNGASCVKVTAESLFPNPYE